MRRWGWLWTLPFLLLTCQALVDALTTGEILALVDISARRTSRGRKALRTWDQSTAALACDENYWREKGLVCDEDGHVIVL